MQDLHFPLRTEDIHKEATKLLQARYGEDETLGVNWVYDVFFKDNPSLKLKRAKGLDRARAHAVGLNELQGWYDDVSLASQTCVAVYASVGPDRPRPTLTSPSFQLENAINKYNIKFENKWGHDETGFQLGKHI